MWEKRGMIFTAVSRAAHAAFSACVFEWTVTITLNIPIH